MSLPPCPPWARLWASLALVLVLTPKSQAQEPELFGAGPRTPEEARRLTSRVDYVIQARVDGETKRLVASEAITWTNNSADPVTDLWFHLYLNAFSNNRSTHIDESGGSLRGMKKSQDEWGWQRVTAVQVGGVDVMGSFAYRQPDDENTDDRSVFSVDLAEPVPPGGSVAIELEWESQLPRVRRRTGHKEDFLFVAQWFPKLGVYESGAGWNCHQFHSSTEFFSDYGTYDVTLNLPAEYAGKVGGSGVKATPKETPGEGRTLERFLAPSEDDRRLADRTGKLPVVHDFTWTADPDYHVYQETFLFGKWARQFEGEVARARAAFGPDKDLTLRDVDVTVLMQPERAGQAQRHADATMTALFFYGLWFGEYPYEHVTVVDPAWGARGASGMEYPTLFTAGTQLFTYPEMHRPEGVTIHEAGHQFWYGLVGNNEFEAAWLDEGFNSYTDSEALIRRYGEQHRTTTFAGLFYDGMPIEGRPGGGRLGRALSGRKLRIPFTKFDLEPLPESDFLRWWRDQPLLSYATQRRDPRWGDRSGYLSDPDSDPMDTHAWKYVDRRSYRTNSYPRPAAALRSLIGVVGYDAFLRGMRFYSETWRYAHPYPQDFFDAFNVGAGVDVSWYFEEVFRGTGTVDWSVDVDQKKVPDAKGWFQEGTGAFARTDIPTDDDIRDDQKGPTRPGADDEEEEEAKPETQWAVDIVVRRKGTLRLPLVCEIGWADGSRELLTWSREDQAMTKWWRPLADRGDSDQKVVSVVLDPERLYYLDGDMSDNQWYSEKDELAPQRWAERSLTQYTQTLLWYAGIGG